MALHFQRAFRIRWMGSEDQPKKRTKIFVHTDGCTVNPCSLPSTAVRPTAVGSSHLDGQNIPFADDDPRILDRGMAFLSLPSHPTSHPVSASSPCLRFSFLISSHTPTTHSFHLLSSIYSHIHRYLYRCSVYLCSPICRVVLNPPPILPTFLCSTLNSPSLSVLNPPSLCSPTRTILIPCVAFLSLCVRLVRGCSLYV